MKRIVLVGLGILSAVAVAGPAGAHAEVDTTTPALSAPLKSCPAEVKLHFTERVAVNGLTLTALDRPLAVTASNADATEWAATTAGACGTDSLDLSWKSTSADDGHVAEGQLHFAIATAPVARATSTSGPSAEALAVAGIGGLLLVGVAATGLRRKAKA